MGRWPRILSFREKKTELNKAKVVGVLGVLGVLSVLAKVKNGPYKDQLR
jgi:hypothetical protein